jgi:hypothetical protein
MTTDREHDQNDVVWTCLKDKSIDCTSLEEKAQREENTNRNAPKHGKPEAKKEKRQGR